MIDFDSMDIELLEEFLKACAQDKHKQAVSIFPDKHSGYVRDLNFLEKYAKEKIEAIKDRLAGRIERALKHEENCEKYYRALSEDARW